MKPNKFAAVSNEALVKNEKKVKALTLVFGGVLLLLFITTLVLTVKKGFTPLIVTPIALLPLLIVSLNNWNDMKKEIRSRNIQE